MQKENSDSDLLTEINKRWPWPSTKVSNRKIGKCPVCGIDLYQQMMYACQRFPCPTGLGTDITL